MAIENDSLRHSHIAATLDGVAANVRVKIEALFGEGRPSPNANRGNSTERSIENGEGIGRKFIMSFVPGLYRDDDIKEALATLKASGRLVQITRDVERAAARRAIPCRQRPREQDLCSRGSPAPGLGARRQAGRQHP